MSDQEVPQPNELTGEFRVCSGDIDTNFEGEPFQTTWTFPELADIRPVPTPDVEVPEI